MSEVKWIKVATDIFEDEKMVLISRRKDGDRLTVIWLKLLCLAGKQNNSGVFMLGQVPIGDALLAELLHCSNRHLAVALDLFCELGMTARINGALTIVNWGKHQSLDNLERWREKRNKYMRDYREKQRQIIKAAEDECEGKCSSYGSGYGNASVTGTDKEGEEDGDVYVSTTTTTTEKELIDDYMASLEAATLEAEHAAKMQHDRDLADILGLWFDSISRPPSIREKDELAALFEQYGAERLREAICTAAAQGKVTIAYTLGILRRGNRKRFDDKKYDPSYEKLMKYGRK